MAKRKEHQSLERNQSANTLEDRLVQYSERLGWLVGTVQAKTEGSFNRAALTESLVQIREGATDLLTYLSSLSSRPNDVARKAEAKQRPLKKPDARAAARGASLVAAPGKRHRPPAVPTPGVKHSDERVSKLKAAKMKGRRGARD
jgi:hypothetical protein